MCSATQSAAWSFDLDGHQRSGDSLSMFEGAVRSLVRWFCSGCGSGFAAKAPGTCGSVAALIFWWLLADLKIVESLSSQLVLVLVTTVVGTTVVSIALKREQDEDPQWIVIDEWAGLFVALVGIAPFQIGQVLLVFVLFRVFDASKVGPVGWAERLPRQFGIMADDLVAGALSALVLWIGNATWLSLTGSGAPW
jgi:phosphatidylglycerophosphatase A